MFGQSRPSFGAGSTSFSGFGSNTSTGFGSSTAFGRPTLPFGASQQTTASSTPFGSNTATGTSSLFGQSQNAGTGLFGSTNSTGFGSNTFAASGSGLFGTTSTPTNTSGGGLFGNPSTSTGFNANQAQSRPFSFGTPTTSSGGGGLFGSTTTGTSGSLFGSNVGQTQGTTIKYNPVTGNDTMTRSGVTQTIQTKIEVITAMKEYETKSLEELRVEDYLNGRKGSTSGTGFGFNQSKFGMGQPANSTSSWLSGTAQSSGGGLFGQKPAETKPLFGSPTPTATAFGTTSGGLFGQTAATPFGQTTPAASTGFPFGQSTQAKPSGFAFGSQTTASSIFGTPSSATQSGTTFGSSFSFGGPQTTQAGGLFGTQSKLAFGAATTGTTSLFGNKPAGTGFGGFGTPSTASPFGTINTNTGSGLFGNQNKPGFSLGTSQAPAFGTTTSTFGGGGLFGSNANQKPGGLSFGSTGGFGTNTSLGFGFNQPATSSGGLFGNTSGGGLFGSNNLGTSSSFGTSLGTTGFSMSTLQPNMNNMNNNTVNNSNISQLIRALTHNPFGTSSLLKSAAAPTGKANELLNSPTSTNSNDNDKLNTSKKPMYVLPTGSGNSSKPRPVVLNRSINGHLDFDSGKSLLFSGLEDKNDSFSEDPFKPKSFPSVKKLNLKVFKTSKSSIGQSTTTSSILNENTNLNDPTPLTTPITSPSNLEISTRCSHTPLQDDSPTPDIIKGRNNIKRLNIDRKNNMNDTLAELNAAVKSSTSGINSIPANFLDSPNESIKDSSISLFEPANIDEGADAINISSLIPHPAGIKLTRCGYYCMPTLEDLAEMVDEDGVCMVENFTVGRYGYGNVCFQGVTNVANMDIDAFVFIVRKEIEVYPEGVEKPQIGEGLNKPAYVTLDCVWPVDKSNHEVIKSQDRLDAMGWSDYLEKQCIKMDSTFVEYRPETGSWVFKVKHFSKYGLQEESEEQLPTGGTAAAITVESKVIDASIQPINGSVITSINNSNTAQPLSSTRANLPATSYSGTVPLFSTRNSTHQGPPALGLVSPPSTNFPQGPLEAATTSVMRKVYLDGSNVEAEHDLYDSMEDDLENDFICPLSPSAERLTISTKAPPRAIQTLKSQLFMGDLEDEYEASQSNKGEKRDVSEFIQTSSSVYTPNDSSIFALRGSSKKLLGNRANRDSFHIADSSFQQNTFSKEISESENIPSFPEKDDESSEICDMEPLPLRDPRTEYQLLPTSQQLEIDYARSFTYHLSTKIPIESSLATKGNHCIADAASFMSRSFRVGWGPGWTLVHGGPVISSSSIPTTSNDDDDGLSESSEDIPFLYVGSTASRRPIEVATRKTLKQKLTIEKIHLSKDKVSSTNLDSLLEACLQNVLECSSHSTPENESDLSDFSTKFFCPSIIPSKGISLLHRLSVTAAQVEDSENRDKSLSSMFDLCVALWGQLDFYSPESDGDSEYAQAQARKEALSQWLEEGSEGAVAEETERALASEEDEAYLEAVFSHLTGRQISEACNLAQDKGDHHLALLLSQCCLGDETSRQIMSQQLSNWAWAGLDTFISASRLVLYSLLGGKPTHEASHTKLNTCTGLDWRRALAIHLWYVCPTTSIISEVLTEYEKAAGLHESKENIYCEEPKPPYLSISSLPENVTANHDVCFQLLKLSVDPSQSLETLLDTSSVTADPLNVTYTWLLWIILQSLGYTHLPLNKAEALHSSMASLLEASGQWHWAAFIILCIPNEQKKKHDLAELLNRHLLIEGEKEKEDPFYREKEYFLLKDLKLPEQWLHKAKAVRARSLNRRHEEAWYLIQAGEYNRAHSLVIEEIAPHAVINEDHEYLLSYLREFSDENIKCQVVDWASGGGIYFNYLEVIQQVEDLKQSRQPTGPKVESLRPKLLALCTRLNNLKCSSAVHRLSISEMSRMVISVLRAILGDEPDGIRVLAQQVSALPLAHESALEELNQITHQYLTQVTMETN